MSKENIKKYNQFINESLEDFDNIFKLVKKYIDYTLKSETKINDFVPNVHIAMVFKEVLHACEKEYLYPEVYHNIPSDPYDTVVDKSKFDFIDGKYYKKEKMRISFIDHLDEYFNLNRLKKDGIKEIHRTYQMLRRKEDIIRNNLKLIDIRIPDEYNMVHKVRKDLRTDKIKIK